MATTISVMRLHANGCDYCIPSDTNRTSWCEWYALVSWNTNLPPFLPPLSPTTPITPYNPPNSPLKQINCLRPPRQNGATTATTECFAKVLSPYNPLSPKVIPLASRADRRWELAWGLDWWMVCDYFTWRIDFILLSVEYVGMLHNCMGGWLQIESDWPVGWFYWIVKSIEVFFE